MNNIIVTSQPRALVAWFLNLLIKMFVWNMTTAFRRTSKNTASILATVSAALSYVLLFQSALGIGLRPTFQVIVNFYAQFKHVLLVTTGIEEIAHFISTAAAHLFPWKIHLMSHWSDIFLLLFLYFVARARSYWATGAKEHAKIRLVLGFFSALLTGVAAGISHENELIGSASVSGATFLGIFIYELIASAIGAWRYRKQEQTWAEEFWRYLTFSLPTSAFSLVLFFANIVFETSLGPSPKLNYGIITILLYSTTVAIYWAYRGWLLSRNPENRYPGETQIHRFWRSSTTKISFYMAASFLGAIAFVLSGAGWSTLAH